MLRSDLCHYGDVHIVVKGWLIVTSINVGNRRMHDLGNT